MTGLAALVHGLAGRSGVQAVLLVSHDGLPIEHAAQLPRSSRRRSRRSRQRWASTPAGWDRAPTAAISRRRCSTTPAASWCWPSVGNGDWLALLARPDADIGPLLYDLRAAPTRDRQPTLALRAAPLLSSPFAPVMRWAVLLAGGSGTRFWPLSTPENPKQLLPLSGSGSSAEESVERLVGLIPRERILVVAGEALADRLRERLEPVPQTTCWSSRARLPRHPRSSGPPGRRGAEIPTPRCSRCTPTGRWAMRRHSAAPPTWRSAIARRHDRLVTVGVVPVASRDRLRLHRARGAAR